MKPLGIAVGGLAVVALTATRARAAGRIPYEPIFDAQAKKYAVPKRLMVAVVAHESKFDPRAVNHETAADVKRGRNVDSLGLGQVLWPDTAKDYGIVLRDELFDPAINLNVTARILRDKLRRYPVGLEVFPADAVSAYNGGHSLRTSGGGFANQVYVDSVRAQWDKYADA